MQISCRPQLAIFKLPVTKDSLGWAVRSDGPKISKGKRRYTVTLTEVNIMTSKTPSPVVRPDEAPSAGKTVIAGLASIPSRVNMLERAFNSIYWQVDEIYVYLNNFGEVPEFLMLPGVHVFRSQDFEDYKDVGKFFALRLVDRGIFLTVDDDIIYPTDYVQTMLAHLERTAFKAVVGVHGIQFPKFPKSFFDRHVFSFNRELESMVPVSMLGTGTTAFDIEAVGLKFTDFTSYGMADVHLAAHMRKNDIPAFAVPRPPEWLIEIGAVSSDVAEASLYNATKKNAAPHNAVIRSLSPWGQADALAKVNALPSRESLAPSVSYAFAVIERAAANEQNISAKVQADTLQRPFISAKPWIEIYADPEIRQRIYIDAIKTRPQGEARRIALEALWSLDKAAAIKSSRRIVQNNPNDTFSLLQHAKFCVGFYLVEEADEFFLKAARLAEPEGPLKQSEALFEYFNFLASFGNYGRALAVSESIGKTHAGHPLFNAWMTLIHLYKRSPDSAEKHLTALAQAPGKRRGSSLQTVARILADSVVQINTSTPLVTSTAVDALRSNAPQLVSLLKIATLVKDRAGATRVWAALNSDHSHYLQLHAELVWFYESNWHNKDELLCRSAGRLLPSGKGDTAYSEFQRIAALGASASKNESGPLVSVLVTAYNSSETIEFAVESILNQTHQNLELIIVDDMSTDDTYEKACSLARRDGRVSVLQSGSNSGPYVSRNIALSYAKGEYIAIQDADDAALPDRLEIQIGNFNDDTKAIIGRHVRMDQNGSVRLENDGSIIGHGPMTLCFKREIISEMGPFASVRTRGDKEFESRITNFFGAHTLVKLPHLLNCSLYDVETNSRVQTATFEKKRDLMLFKEKYARDHSEGLFV